MSYHLPSPGALLKEKRDSAESELRASSTISRNDPVLAEDLYRWAGEVIQQLLARGESNPKLKLAKALGITRDAHWAAPARKLFDTPRHRVIARFAREGIWDSIWSLNWDYLQESALINVGIKKQHAAKSAVHPWPTEFATFITAAECAHIGTRDLVHVVKPHGCALSLVESEAFQAKGDLVQAEALADRFLITDVELQERIADNGTELFVFHRLCAQCHTQPLVVVGWSVSEQYLRTRFRESVKPILAARGDLAVDELSIVDICFNNVGHAELADSYGKTDSDVHIAVQSAGPFTTDNLFLWLQALYGLGRILPHVAEATQDTISRLLAEIAQPPDMFPYTVEWVDYFLPAWVRLCWRLDLVKCRDRDGRVTCIDSLAIDVVDEHIPWQVDNIERPDLNAAGHILAAIDVSPRKADWSVVRFPGAFYRASDCVLAIPIPIWGEATQNVLRGFKPIVDRIISPEAGSVAKIWIIPITDKPNAAVTPDTVNSLRVLLSDLLNLPRFTPDKIESRALTDL